MKTLCKAVVLASVLVMLSGCAVTGTWSMKSIDPATAKAHFNLQCMKLGEDNTFTACAKEGDQCKMLTGTYTYDANTKKLVFKSDGKERTYTAELVALGGELKIQGGEKAKAFTAVMTKGCKCTEGKCLCQGKCTAQCQAKPEAKKDAKAEPKKDVKPEPKKDAKSEPKKDKDVR